MSVTGGNWFGFDDIQRLDEALKKVQERVAHVRELRLQASVEKSTQLGKNSDMDILEIAAKAASIYAGRRARDQLFSGLSLFAEPAWDLMLDLFVHSVRGNQISISSACIAAAVAPTTALRWIEALARDGLIQRVPDIDDRRRSFLRLTERGFTLISKAIAIA